jgi:hypothetical protein
LAAALLVALAAPLDAADDAPAVSIYDVVRYGVASKRVRKTEMVGFSIVKTEYVDVSRPAGVLVGFDVGLGPFNDELAIYALRPIFQNAKQTAASKSFGLFQDEVRNNLSLKTKVKEIVRLMAKPGYAVGEVTLDRGLFLEGLSLRYMKIAGPALDPSDAYTSRWVGSPTGENRATLSGGGAPIVGIHGNLDRDVRGLGLIYLDPAVYLNLNTADRVSPAAPASSPAQEKHVATAPIAVTPAPAAEETATNAASSESKAAAPANQWVTGVVFIGVTCLVLVGLFAAFGRRSSTTKASAANAVLAAKGISTGSANVPPIVPAMLGVAIEHRMSGGSAGGLGSPIAATPVYGPPTGQIIDAVLVD